MSLFSRLLRNADQSTPAAAVGKRCETARRRLHCAAVAAVEMLEPRQMLSASNIRIVPTYDSSITNLAGASTIENTIQAAINQIEGLVTANSPMTVTIDFQNQNSGLGASATPQQDIPYSTYLADLKANPNKSANQIEALSTMPAGPNTGINNATMVLLTAANLDAIGDTTDATAALASGNGFYGNVYLNLSIMNYSRPGTNANNYDLESTALHEIDEVLGIGGNGTTLYQPGGSPPASLPTDVSGLDFFRYSASGVRSFTYSDTATAYFSINGGQTRLVYFNQDNGSDGADFGDWDNPQNNGNGNNPPQVQDAFGGPGITSTNEPNLGTNELTAFEAVGYNLFSAGPASTPVVTVNPTNQSVVSGATATFTANATGTPTPSVQWQVSVNSGPFTNISGATSDTLSVVAASGDNGNQYRAVFTNSAGTATTTAATLSVVSPIAPVIATNPTSQSATSGESITFTASATGMPAPTVQWQVSVSGGAFTNIAGATSDQLSIVAAVGDSGNEYQAVFTNSVGTATTTIATLTVITNSAPFVTSNPTNQNAGNNSTATFSATAIGFPVPSVQWQVSVNGGGFTNISGATSATLNIVATPSENGNLYRAVFANSAGTASSTAATLTVISNSAPVVITNPTNQSAIAGDRVIFTAAAIGYPTPSVQWQVSINGGSYANIPGATSASLSIVAIPNNSDDQYRAVFTNSISTAATTSATLNLTSPVAPVVSTNPTNQTVASGDTAIFTVAAGGFPTPTVQWQVSTDGGAFTDIPGATSTTLNIAVTSDDNGNQYQAVFTNSVGSATTTATTLTLAPALPLPVTPLLKGTLPTHIVVAGQKTRIVQTLYIENGSATTFVQATSIGLYLSTGTDGVSDLIKLPASLETAELNLKTLRYKSFHIQSSLIPASTPPGQYRLVVILSNSNGQTSVGASVGTITVAAPRADLSATLADVSLTGKIGNDIGVTLIVTNNGNISADGPLLIDLYSSLKSTLDQTAVTLAPMTTHINIKPGKSAKIHLSGIMLSSTAGPFFLIAKIDPNNTFNDVDLSNNVAASIQVVLS